jgi:hypothetical protein
LYPHVKVSDDAKVCQAFVNDGWCDRGEECEERHAWECREYSETGECSKGVRCGLMHVLRAKGSKGAKNEEEEEDEEEGVDDSMPLRKKSKVDGVNAVNAVNAEYAVDVTGDFEGQEDFIQFPTVVDVSTDGDEREESVDSDETEDEGENAVMSSSARA